MDRVEWGPQVNQALLPEEGARLTQLPLQDLLELSHWGTSSPRRGGCHLPAPIMPTMLLSSSSGACAWLTRRTPAVMRAERALTHVQGVLRPQPGCRPFRPLWAVFY